MSVPGFTAELSLRRANGHYQTASTSPHVQGMVVPQMMEVFAYIPDWALESGSGGSSDPYGSSIGYPTLSDTIKCMRECAFTVSSCKRDCRSLPAPRPRRVYGGL
jgi:hypothetical protein